jgi:hypothetical protein
VGAAAARASAQALCASQLSRMPEDQRHQLQLMHGFTGGDASRLAIITCKVIGKAPKRG